MREGTWWLSDLVPPLADGAEHMAIGDLGIGYN
jgi:hypothetical protein